MEIILYSDDITLLVHWEKALKNENYKIIYDFESLKKLQNSIIILNANSCQEDCKTFLNFIKIKNNKVLILDRVPELTIAKKLLKYGAFGYGNTLMNPHFILSAIDAIKEGMIWLYPELTSQLILEIPETKSNNDVLERLTLREKEVALLLKESLTYNEISKRLDISPRTVKAHAQAIYHKLDVKDRLGLALLLK
jgi:DNA-binding NarL/FixJ family response regulator